MNVTLVSSTKSSATSPARHPGASSSLPVPGPARRAPWWQCFARLRESARGMRRENLRQLQMPAVRFARELRGRAQTIRVITYTKNAALVVAGRLGTNDLTQVATIHSFCWDLIAGFDGDIREALLAMNADALQKARDAAAGRKKRRPDRKRQGVFGELNQGSRSRSDTAIHLQPRP